MRSETYARCATSFTNEFNDQVQGENLYTQIDFSDTEWRYYFSSKLLPTLGPITYDNGDIYTDPQGKDYNLGTAAGTQTGLKHNLFYVNEFLNHDVTFGHMKSRESSLLETPQLARRMSSKTTRHLSRRKGSARARNPKKLRGGVTTRRRLSQLRQQELSTALRLLPADVVKQIGKRHPLLL